MSLSNISEVVFLSDFQTKFFEFQIKFTFAIECSFILELQNLFYCRHFFFLIVTPPAFILITWEHLFMIKKFDSCFLFAYLTERRFLELYLCKTSFFILWSETFLWLKERLLFLLSQSQSLLSQIWCKPNYLLRLKHFKNVLASSESEVPTFKLELMAIMFFYNALIVRAILHFKVYYYLGSSIRKPFAMLNLLKRVLGTVYIYSPI